jgi:NAD(P)-dependent dehydrogenase (short-subunit alcohol dehydrogenase family)
MKVYILGASRGLGYELGELFKVDGHQVIEIDRSTGVDIKTDYQNFLQNIETNSLVIINAYANGSQIAILEQLINRKNKVVVMGSIAARYRDSSMPAYSKHKKDLEDYFMHQAIETKESDLLILNLTGKSYLNSKLIYNSINFWLLNTDIIAFSYRTK